MKLTLSLVMAALIGLCFTPAWAQEAEMDESAGLQNQVRWVAPQEFQRVEDSGGGDWDYESDLELYDDGPDGDARWRAQFHLPDGARIVRAQWYLFDDCADDPDEDSIDVWLSRVTPDCGGPTTISHICSAETFTDSGYTCLDCDFAVPGNRVVRNNNSYYLAIVEFDTTRCGDRDHRLSGVKITYRLQVSPAPALPTFEDVPPGHIFFREIEALVDSGITQGCDSFPPRYCPDHAVTRGQMAAFLARALGLYWAP